MIEPLLTWNPGNGSWDLTKGADGNPKTTDSEQHAVATQLSEYRGTDGKPGWVWDSTPGSGTPNTHGSLIYTITEDNPTQRSLFAAYALDALQPLVDAGRIANPAASIQRSQVTGRLDGVVSWTTPSGQPQTFVVPIAFP